MWAWASSLPRLRFAPYPDVLRIRMPKAKPAVVHAPNRTSSTARRHRKRPKIPRTSSTIWPELMTWQVLTRAGVGSTKPPSSQAGPALAQASLALLSELAASLEASQKALLARDVDAVEQGTREQVRLRRALEILWTPGAPHWRNDPAASSEPRCDHPLAADLRAAERRVLLLGRVQAGLLARAQRALRTISNLLAGPEASYGPPSSAASTTASTTSAGAPGQRHPEEPNSCRA